MIAALILIVGAGAAFSLIDSANRSVTSNSARVGATNLGRELTEYARTTDYDLLQPRRSSRRCASTRRSPARSRGGVWTIQRRNVTYTVTTDRLHVRRPEGRHRRHAAAERMPGGRRRSPASPADVNADDFRRVDVHAHLEDARPRAAHHAAGRADRQPRRRPRPAHHTSSTQPAAQITGDLGRRWGAAYAAEATRARPRRVRCTGRPTTASAGRRDRRRDRVGLRLDLGTAFEHDQRRGCATARYTIQAQAFDSRGVPGEGEDRSPSTSTATRPRAADRTSSAATTRRATSVDMRWDRYDERDLQGYSVVRLDDNRSICALQRTAAAAPTRTRRSRRSSSPIYAVYAVDCTDLRRRPRARATARCDRAAPRPARRRGDRARRADRAHRLGRRRQADALVDRAGHRARTGRSASTASTATPARTSPTATTRPSPTRRTTSIPNPARRPTTATG